MTPPSQRIFVCGATGSGKTAFLRSRYLGEHTTPRLLVCDQTGEFEGEGWPVCDDVAGCLRLLKEVAPLPRWRVVAYLGSEEISELSRVALCPIPNIRDGYAARVGGMALLVDEVDAVFPQGSQDKGLRSLWRRGRHAGLSIYAATQRPGNANREITSQSQWLVIFRQHEHRDMLYLQNVLGRETAAACQRWVTVREYNAYAFDVIRRVGYRIGPDGTATLDRTPQRDVFDSNETEGE